jgi:prolipoprotein diacylglyceryl transferase
VISASVQFLASFPSPDRGVWHIGPIPIRAYALCIIAGIIVALWWSERRWVARGGTKGTVIDVAVFAVPFGLVGGRLYHVITDHQLYFGAGKNPVNALKIWDGGLGIWGAVALGGLGAFIACRRKGIPLPAMADTMAPALVTAQAIGRIGNYFNQELYGAHTTLPWGLEIYQRINPDNPGDTLGGIATGHIPLPDSPVQPTFLYELIWDLLIALLVVWADKRFRLGHGRAFWVYVAGYTVGRCWIELLRADEANHIFGVRVNVWVAILVFLGAVTALVITRNRGPRESPESLRGFLPPDVDAAVAEGPTPEGDSESVSVSADSAEPSASSPPPAEDAKPPAE